MSDDQQTVNDEAPSDQSFIMGIFYEVLQSPLNIALVGIITFLIYKIFKSRHPDKTANAVREPELPKLRKDFTVQELIAYDGNQPDGRVLVAVNGSVYDVTRGKRFYGPGGPYAAFGGRDASRGLATFSVTTNANLEYDDLSDLNSMEMESIREWEMQFKEKYELCGRLLKPGEQPTNYSDDDEEPNTNTSSSTTSSTPAATSEKTEEVSDKKAEVKKPEAESKPKDE